MRKLVYLLLFLTVALGLVLIWAWPQLGIVTGYAAKKACSYSFIAKRDLSSIQEIDLADFPLNLVQLEIDKANSTATASVMGMSKSTAILRQGLGCTLLQGKDDYNIEKNSHAKPSTSSTLLPRKSNYNNSRISKATAMALDKPGEWEKKTTSLLIVHKDSLVYETYADGFDSETEILGWSMTKSVCNLLIGMMAKDGLLKLNENMLFPAWENDERKNITIENLLRMDTGLEWTEEYAAVCDITRGLFQEEDFVQFARNKKLETLPGKAWEYASGSTNLLSGIMRRKFESYQDYLNFPQLRLFDKLGIADAYIETDEAGNFIMSSYMYAKAGDWAKLGLLYLHKGKWEGEHLVDEDYLARSLRHQVEPIYGYHIWLNTDQALYPSAPADAYKFSGYEGQYVIVIPSMELVVVRTGVSKGPPFDMDVVLGAIVKYLEVGLDKN